MGARRLDEEGVALLHAAVADADKVARRERKIVRVTGSECWWWTEAISGKGRGRFWFAPDRVIIAHRFGFAQADWSVPSAGRSDGGRWRSDG